MSGSDESLPDVSKNSKPRDVSNEYVIIQSNEAGRDESLPNVSQLSKFLDDSNDEYVIIPSNKAGRDESLPDVSKHNKPLDVSNEEIIPSNKAGRDESLPDVSKHNKPRDVSNEEFIPSNKAGRDEDCSKFSTDSRNVSFGDVPLKDTSNGHAEENGNDSVTPVDDNAEVYKGSEHSSGKGCSSGDSSNSATADPSTDHGLSCEEEESELDEFEEVEIEVDIEENDVVEIMKKLGSRHYSVSQQPEDEILGTCKELFKKDYHCDEFGNLGGYLCENYPVRVIVPIAKKTRENERFLEFDIKACVELVESTAIARCRKRFPAPAILFDNKYICRSGTLSNVKVAFYETATQNQPEEAQPVDGFYVPVTFRILVDYAIGALHRAKKAAEAALQLMDLGTMEKLRDDDKQIMRHLKILRICDLMVENEKIYKYLISVGSSEKANVESYKDFKIEKMPYPGCEFFKKYHDHDRNADGLVFDWKNEKVEIDLELTEDMHESFPDVDWDKYKDWDIIKLTQNYIKILLSYLVKDDRSILVHCISGWDRTPLVISLLRLSLWADGVIHETLNELEMAYLTLAYDWYLFGHNLPARLQKKEEIMRFCFDVLSEIASDEFSVTRMFGELTLEEQAGRNFPVFQPGRRNFLVNFSQFILKIYDEHITPILQLQ